jgi:hypothetical protein
MLMAIYECNFSLCIHIITCIFINEFECVLLDFTNKQTNQKKNVIRGFLEDVANRCGSWFLTKGAPPGLYCYIIGGKMSFLDVLEVVVGHVMRPCLKDS